MLHAIYLMLGLLASNVPGQDAEQVHVTVLERITWQIDGAKMVLIPSGSFSMGASKVESESFMKDAHPSHVVSLDAFYMDMYEVTLGQYKQFLMKTNHRKLPDWVSEFSPTDKHPVVGVSWLNGRASDYQPRPSGNMPPGAVKTNSITLGAMHRQAENNVTTLMQTPILS